MLPIEAAAADMEGTPVRSFAEKLNALIKAMTNDDGSTISANQLVARFNETSPVTMSNGYFSELRAGVVTNPRIDLVEAIADFFGISASYFVSSPDDDVNVERVRLLGAMRRSGVSNLGARTSGLSEGALNRIADAIESERVRASLDSAADPAPKKKGGES